LFSKSFQIPLFRASFQNGKKKEILNFKIAKPVEEVKPIVVQPIFKPVIEETNQEPHKGVACDKCGKQNFTGKRYQCTSCSDYDLCETCFPSRSKFHSSNHPFKMVKRNSFLTKDCKTSFRV
jgi:hypothetical protein